MKKNFFGVVAFIFISIIIFGCVAKQTNESEDPVKEPEPLVIESTQWTPHGVFNGTIVISGNGIEETGYEGIMYVEMDGNKIRISCTEAVRSRYGELF